MGTQRDGRFALRDSVDMGRTFRYDWGPAYLGGARFLLADGSVRVISYAIDPIGMKAFLAPDGRDIPTDF
jgi:hypothetical protein